MALRARGAVDRPARASRAASPWRWGPFVVGVAFGLTFIARTAFTVHGDTYFSLFDDAMISMRYARNLAQGHGLVWNPGQAPVEGYTNFLWTLWMAGLHLLGVPEAKLPLLVMLSGLGILLANLVVVRRIAANLAPDAPLVASLSMWFTALYYPLIYWTLLGTEVGLITLLVATSVMLALRLRKTFRVKDISALAAVTALGVLTRTEIVVPSVIVLAFVCSTVAAERRWWAATVLFGTLVATLTLHTGFRLAYYGSPFPNTYYLKLQGIALGLRLDRGLVTLLYIGVIHLIVPVGISVGYLIARRRWVHPGVHLIVAIFLGLCLYSVYVGGDAWEWMQYANRYITPGVPGLFIVTALGIDAVCTKGSDREDRAGGFLAGPFLLAMLFFLAAVLCGLQTSGSSPTDGDTRLRLVCSALILGTALVLVLMPLWRAKARRLELVPRTRQPSSLVISVITIGSLVAVNGRAISVWLNHNAFYVDDDAWATRYGVALRDATAENALVAVTWAGAIPYFSHRQTVDLLGKSDRAIAASEPQGTIGFQPGHNKWNYAFSVGALRPDIVAQLWHATDTDFAAIESLGYSRVAPWVFVRSDTRLIDGAAVKSAACEILAEDPVLLGSETRQVADRDELWAEYCSEVGGR